MPGRSVPLVTGEIYHVFNRGITGQVVFPTQWAYRRFLNAAHYYQYVNLPLRFAQFASLPAPRRKEVLTRLKNQRGRRVSMLVFCLMPNHFHFLMRQEEDGGIARFASDLLNSYTRYVNTKHQRQGPLFKGRFKAVRIEDDEQLLHVVRYILLNPYTSHLLRHPEETTHFPYSSFSDYLNPSNARLSDPRFVLTHFASSTQFKSFVLDYADYQRSLHHIQHLALE